MKVFPNCKINIGLRVIGKREDGYHNLETIFYPIYGLHDTLEIEPASEFSYTQTGIALDCDAEQNLVVRCYRNMQEKFSQIGAVSIRLDKHIPSGAGLGGGSSDAAFTAIALNQLFNLNQSAEQLAHIVSQLGADCPFFIYNKPCYATGIGDILQPIDLDLSHYRIVMIKPDISISTREAYAGIQLHPEAKGLLLKQIQTGDWKNLCNDFEKTVFTLHPDLQRIKELLLRHGAIYAQMSGSGATLFGLFNLDTECRTDSWFSGLDIQSSAMILLNDTLAQS